MLQLNVHLQYSRMSPNRAVVIIRTAARSLRIVVKSLFQRVRGRRAADMEAGAGEEKTAENSLVTRPGFSFKEPRRAASAGLVRKVKIYHSSIDLQVLDGFGGARWRNNSIPQ